MALGPRNKGKPQIRSMLLAIQLWLNLTACDGRNRHVMGLLKKNGGYPNGKLTDDVFFSKTNGFWAFPIDARAICRAMFKTSGSGGTQLPQSLELGQPQVQRPQLHRKRARVGRVVRGCHLPGVERTLARTWCCGTQQISISLEIR